VFGLHFVIIIIILKTIEKVFMLQKKAPGLQGDWLGV